MKNLKSLWVFVAGVAVGLLLGYGAMYLSGAGEDGPANLFRWNRGGNMQEMKDLSRGGVAPPIKPRGGVAPPIKPRSFETFRVFKSLSRR